MAHGHSRNNFFHTYIFYPIPPLPYRHCYFARESENKMPNHPVLVSGLVVVTVAAVAVSILSPQSA